MRQATSSEGPTQCGSTLAGDSSSSALRRTDPGCPRPLLQIMQQKTALPGAQGPPGEVREIRMALEAPLFQRLAAGYADEAAWWLGIGTREGVV